MIVGSYPWRSLAIEAIGRHLDRGGQGAAPLMFKLRSPEAKVEAAQALVAVGAAILRELAAHPGSGWPIGELIERAESASPAPHPVDAALFWELLQVEAGAAGGVLLPFDGLMIRYPIEQVIFGAFVVATSLIGLAAATLGLEPQAVLALAMVDIESGPTLPPMAL